MAVTREIDRQAQNIFNMGLPPTWLVRKQDPDIHIDYFVETTSGSEPSGLVFGGTAKRYEKARPVGKFHQVFVEDKTP